MDRHIPWCGSTQAGSSTAKLGTSKLLKCHGEGLGGLSSISWALLPPSLVQNLGLEPQNSAPTRAPLIWMGFFHVRNLLFFNMHTIIESKTSPFSFTPGKENDN